MKQGHNREIKQKMKEEKFLETSEKTSPKWKKSREEVKHK